MNLLSKIKPWNFGLIAALGLWLMVWAGYNANFWRVVVASFPLSFLDAFQGMRAFLPLLAMVLAIIFIAVKKYAMPKGFFLKPLGLFLLYSLVGIFSSIFSKDLSWALYWAAMYGAVVMVLVALSYGHSSLKKIASIISLNWFIAGFLSVALTAFFLIQPGITHSLTINFLFCAGRAYEGFGGVSAAVQTFGMPGTRPTGLGRYAAIMALVAFCRFLYTPKKGLKIVWLAAFVLGLAILLFSKGKTEILVFVFSLASILVIGKRLKWYLVILLAAIMMVSGTVIFYNIPCSNSTNFLTYFLPKKPAPVAPIMPVTPALPVTPAPSVNPRPLPTPASIPPPPPPAPAMQAPPVPPPVVIKPKATSAILTLSGRTNGVWADAWNLFLTSPWLGYGFQADRIFLNGQNAHNTLLHTLIQTGIIGTVPFILAGLLIFYMLYRLLRNPNLPPIQKTFLLEITAVLIFLILRGITESFAFYSADWLFMAPIIAYIQVLYLGAEKLDKPA